MATQLRLGTKLRYLVANNPNELEASVEMLPFKIEIKEIYHHGGKVFLWFTVHDDQSTTAIDNQKIKSVPVKKTKRKKAKKS